MKTQHPKHLAASLNRRIALSTAARRWMKTDPHDDEADIAFDAILRAVGVLDDDDFADEIWSDSPETVMVRVNGSTLIEIDVESGNHMRGTADE